MKRQKVKSLIVLLLICSQTNFAQIPVKQYRAEIKALKSSTAIDEYWNQIYRIDQEVLLKTENDQKRDSISLDNMIKTALLVEVYGKNVIKENVIVHILNLSHNHFGSSQLAYWPIIEASKSIENLNTKIFYPSYVLETISLTFYGYSFLNKEEKYPRALEILNSNSRDRSVVNELILTFQKLKKYRSLNNQKIIGEWYQKPFNNLEEKDTFQFILKEDKNLYFKRNAVLNKLILQTTNESSKVYRVENEPYNWTFKLESSGELSLLDHNNEILIEYRTKD